MIAIRSQGSLGKIKLLLDYGANVNLQDNEGTAPLMYALLFRESVEKIKLLLDYGANINFINKNGRNGSSYGQWSTYISLGGLWTERDDINGLLLSKYLNKTDIIHINSTEKNEIIELLKHYQYTKHVIKAFEDNLHLIYLSKERERNQIINFYNYKNRMIS